MALDVTEAEVRNGPNPRERQGKFIVAGFLREIAIGDSI
jgi:hypothetical protein